MNRKWMGLLLAGSAFLAIMTAGYLLNPGGTNDSATKDGNRIEGNGTPSAISDPGSGAPGSRYSAKASVPAILDNPEGSYETRYGSLPKTLRGTRVDGELPVDSEGHLILVSGIKRRFEYFLAAVSDEGMTVSVARIRENIERSLPPSPAGEARRIL